MQEPIYLDHNATTPVDRLVLEKMLPYFCEVYGNAASIDHLHGNKAKQANRRLMRRGRLLQKVLAAVKRARLYLPLVRRNRITWP